MKGEKLVANGPLFKEGNYGWTVAHSTSTEFTVRNVKVVKKKFLSRMKNSAAAKFEGKYWELQVGDQQYLYVVHDDDVERFKKEAKAIKKLAIKEKSKYLWVQYFTFLKWSHDVAYNYAITAHKSQGSTYDNVLFLEDDANLNKRIAERNRIKYTAYTRAKHKLYLLR
jgi:hypothetical protein